MFATNVSESTISDEFDQNNSETLLMSQTKSLAINHSVGNREYKMQTSEKLDSDEKKDNDISSIANTFFNAISLENFVQSKENQEISIRESNNSTFNESKLVNMNTNKKDDMSKNIDLEKRYRMYRRKKNIEKSRLLGKPVLIKSKLESDEEKDVNLSSANLALSTETHRHKRQRLTEKLPLLEEPMLIPAESEEEKDVNFSSPNISFNTESHNSDVQLNTKTDEEIDELKSNVQYTECTFFLHSPERQFSIEVPIEEEYTSLSNKLDNKNRPIMFDETKRKCIQLILDIHHFHSKLKAKRNYYWFDDGDTTNLNPVDVKNQVTLLKARREPSTFTINKSEDMYIKNDIPRSNIKSPLLDEPTLIVSESGEEKDMNFSSPNLSLNIVSGNSDVQQNMETGEEIDVIIPNVENTEQSLTTNSPKQEMDIILPNAEIAIETSVLGNNTLQQESVSVSTEEHTSLSNELSNNHELNMSHSEIEDNYHTYENEIMNTNTNFVNDIDINEFNITEDISPDRNNSTNTDSILVNNTLPILEPCPVCFNALVTGETMSTTCGHIFCSTCGKTILKRTKTCPQCRKRITPSKIHPLFF